LTSSISLQKTKIGLAASAIKSGTQQPSHDAAHAPQALQISNIADNGKQSTITTSNTM
jgi:hypothetical protein